MPRRQGTFPPLQAAPLTTNFALVGQAFDYLLRFYIQLHNPHAPKNAHWIADWIRAELQVDAGDEEGMLFREYERAAQVFLARAHNNHATYLTTGNITDDLPSSCLDLASIDGLVRAGGIRGSLGQADRQDLCELRNLLDLIPQSPFLDGVPCMLNPIFRFPSGADCDLLIGTTLIEIKTTKFSEIKQDYYQQLLGYYLLNLSDQRSPREIEHIGVYFSRHGYVWTIAIEEIGDKKTFQHFLPVWNVYVERYHQVRRSEEGHSAQSL